VTARAHPNSLLLGKADRYVVLTVNDRPSLEGARRVRVKTLASEVKLRYVDWTQATRRAVEQRSGGRIGYMHIPNVQHEGVAEFIRGFYSQTDKEALIVDERWNTGGYVVQQLLVDTLARKVHLGLQQRNAGDELASLAIEGPKAMLINEYAGSGGDSLPWTFRDAALGPLIGRRTAGALMGQNDALTLIDGGMVFTPEVSLYDRRTGLLAAENVGVEPDIDVDMRPDLVALGQDPQLDAAIQHLLDQLKQLPPRQPRQAVPRVSPAGRLDR
jgi:tricorn protease